MFRALLGAKGEEAVIPVHPKEPVVEGVATQPIEKVNTKVTGHACDLVE